MNLLKKISTILLFPFSIVYGMITGIRNSFFNWGIFEEKEYDIPLISIGNLVAGGTGKTPHTEFLISIFKEKYKTAVLSRGYKRKTKGFILADKDSTAQTIGDEPFQIKSKFTDIPLAVDGNRRRGIEQLLKLKNPDIILLDDAYQHRKIKPGLSVLLTTYNNLYVNDCLLPAGRLREAPRNADRANIVIVTKCPNNLQPIDYLIVKKDLKLRAHQLLFFSTFIYDEIQPVFKNSVSKPLKTEDFKKNNSSILLVTGIVSPQELQGYLSAYTKDITMLSYPDHHDFSGKDIVDIETAFNKINAETKAVIVTEKDAARLVNMDLTENMKKSIYSIGIKVSILQDKENEFKNNLLDYVRKNRRNREFPKK